MPDLRHRLTHVNSDRIHVTVTAKKCVLVHEVCVASAIKLVEGLLINKPKNQLSLWQ